MLVDFGDGRQSAEKHVGRRIDRGTGLEESEKVRKARMSTTDHQDLLESCD